MPQPENVWRSDGYGRVYLLRGDRLTVYETTRVGALVGDELDRIGSPDADGALWFGDDGEPELTLRIGPDGYAAVREIGCVSDVGLIPLPALPRACARPLDADPVTTFDVFWASFAEHYNSLVRKSVDWAAVRDRFRPRVGADTRKGELFRVLRAMIEPLGDSHTGIEAAGGREFDGLRPGTRERSNRVTDRAVDRRLRALGAREFRVFADEEIVFTELPDGRGYLRINGFEEYDARDDSFRAGCTELARTLDAVFTADRVRAMSALVVDVRNNSGGDDELALRVAARLTDRPYLGFTKAARNDPTDPTRYGRAWPVTVNPAEGPRYTGPVRLLTSDMTVSAGETFVLAMMGRRPEPVRIGSTTQGVFSDTLGRELPNGWSFTLGNEEYLGPDGRCYEGTGIPPMIEVPVFTKGELAAKRDSALDAALDSALGPAGNAGPETAG